MWALIEDGSITKIIRYGLNVKVPKSSEPIGNLDLLSVEDRKSLGVYKVVEPEPVDARYYAATYVNNRIDHFNAQVIQTNEISPQPIERIRMFRLDELKEIRDRRMKSYVVRVYVETEQICNSKIDKELPYVIEVDVNEELVSRLTLLGPEINHLPAIFVEDVTGEMHRFDGRDIDVFRRNVRNIREDFYKAYAESRYIINTWNQEDPDGLIELDLEELFQKRFDTSNYIQP